MFSTDWFRKIIESEDYLVKLFNHIKIKHSINYTFDTRILVVGKQVKLSNGVEYDAGCQTPSWKNGVRFAGSFPSFMQLRITWILML